MTSCGDPDEVIEQDSDEEQPEEVEVDTDEETANETIVEEQAKREIDLSEIPPIPTDVEGLANQSAGPLGGDVNLYKLEAEVKEAFDKVGPLGENPTEEEIDQYLRYMYWLVAEDYPDPMDIIKKWEFASFGNPDIPDSRYHFKENYNIAILLDASGSMANDAGSKTRMEVAKEAIQQFLEKTPEEANVSLLVYGHKGTGADSDKELSCSTIEQVYGFASYDDAEFEKAIGQFDPAGWTPLAGALESAHESMKSLDSELNTNLIYVVSDGIETCDGDPVQVAEELANSNVQPIINIIGFQTDAEAQKQLEEIAEVADGIYSSAQNQKELQAEFKRAEEVLEAWERWKKDAMKDIDASRVRANFDILGLHNDWSFTTLGTSNNLSSLANVMQDLEFITFNQKEQIDKKRRSIIAEIDDTVDQLEEDLKKISQDNIEQARKEVEQIFSKETANEE